MTTELNADGDPPERVDEASLWLAMRDGQVDAFAAIFERYADLVYRHLTRRTGSWSEAEDLTGAVFLIVWQRRSDQLAAGSSREPWLLTIATNVARNAARSRRRYAAAVERLPRGHVPDHADQVAAAVDAANQLVRVSDAMRQLPVAEQQALLAVASTEQDSAEAAARLGLPRGTLSSRLSRARSRLRTDLAMPKADTERRDAP